MNNPAPEDARDCFEFLQGLITFFQPRRKWGFVITDRLVGQDLLVWTRNDERLAVDREASFADSWSRLKKSIRSGGIAVCVNRDKGSIRAECIPAPGYEPARNMLFLDVDGTTKQLLLGDRCTCAPGDHFLIPVDAGAEKVLLRLLETLRYLPVDLERSFFHLLARPSLELRVRRLEAMMQGSEPAPISRAELQPMERNPGFWSGASVWVERNEKRLWWTLAIALILVTTALDYLFWLQFHDRRASQIDAQSNGLLAGVANSSSEMIATISKGSDLSSLQSDTPPADRKKFANEVLKLEMAVLDLSTRGTKKELANGDQVTQTMQLLGQKQSAVPANHRELIAWLSCDALRDPNLRVSSNPTGFDMCDFSRDDVNDIAAALQELTEAVNHYKDPPELVPPFAEEAGRLIGEMSASTVTGASVLYLTHHLSELKKNPFEENFAVALVKLELIRLDLLQAHSGDLNDESQVIDTVAAFRDPSSEMRIKKGRNILLAWVLCQATGSPTLKGTAIPGTGPVCHEADAHIPNGFEALTRYVSGTQ